jgi:phenylacetate-CoA ligase
LKSCCGTRSTVPYYAARWRGIFDGKVRLTPDRFSALPVLTRSDLQGEFAALKRSSVPLAHGAVGKGRPSGSTGRRVHTLKTDLTELFGRAFAGRAVALPIRTDVATQLDGLVQQNPDHLLSYPSKVGELARLALACSARIPHLRQARTMGEALSDAVRELCRAAWSVPVTDVYSSDEVGYIALQCPDREHCHVQAESLMVEVLDVDGRSCSAGETGRVVVTASLDFVLPLLRCEPGDYAEAGRAARAGAACR